MIFNPTMSPEEFVKANSSYYQELFEGYCEGTTISSKDPNNFSKREEDHINDIIDDMSEAYVDYVNNFII